MRDSVSRSAQETFWKKFLGNLQKLFKIKGFSNVFMHFSPTARAQSVRDKPVLITPVGHALRANPGEFAQSANISAFTEELRPQPPFVACATAVAGSCVSVRTHSLRDITKILFDVIFLLKMFIYLFKF